MYKLLELTAIWYQASDPLGPVMAALSLLPILIHTSLAALSLCTPPPHSTHHQKLFLGHLLNEFLNARLKRVFRRARPTPGPPTSNDNCKVGDGMPSSHAQFMGFFIAAWACRLPGQVMGVVPEWILFAAAMVAAVLVSYSRVYLRYHSREQVVAGFVIGVGCGRVFKEIFGL
jgi:dolichyldiphosphatase